MEIATYYRTVGDDVRFYKGDMKSLAVEFICEDLLNHLSIIFPDVFWKEYYPILFEFIKIGKYSVLDANPIFENEDVLDAVKEYRKKYKDKEYFTNPRFDKVGITTLFTFYWDITIDTINFAKQLCKSEDDVMVGGIMSSLLPVEQGMKSELEKNYVFKKDTNFTVYQKYGWVITLLKRNKINILSNNSGRCKDV